jgi:S1-C subfamily serine protease
MSIDLTPTQEDLQEELFPTPTDPLAPVGIQRRDVKRRNPRRLLGAVILVVVGLIVGFALASAPADEPAPSVTRPLTAAPVSPAQPAVPAPAVERSEPIVPTQRLDTVADAAAVIGPSVVQISSDAGLGSGVIYTSDGLILTAAHVVDDIDVVDIRLADGRLLLGTVIGTHEPTDVAVISIDADNLTTAVLGYGTSAQVGETAVAVGSPFGFDQTVTAGIVSAVGRNVNGVPMVQTDAAINPGNSGGPLVNSAGHVIGINDVIFTEGGGSDGIGFAIAIDVAIVVADQLVAGTDVELAALGTATIPDTTGNGGAIVGEIVPGFPAEAAGLIVGDRIVAVDGVRIVDPADLFAAIVMNRPGATVVIEFVRDGQAQTLEVVLAGIER